MAYTFDYAGLPLTASGAVTGADYLPFGALKRLDFTNGTRQVLAYDSRYRVDANQLIDTTTSGRLADYDYQSDPAGNIERIDDVLDSGYNRTFGYDDLHRLTSANTGPALWGTGEYQWDAMGNILSMKLGEIPPGGDDGLLRRRGIATDENRPLGRSSSFVYVGATSLLAEVTTNHLARPVTHDAAGHETGHIVTREYSARNLLRTVWDNAEPGGLDHRVIYGYNGRGVRISRLEVPVSPEFGAERHFVYTRLLAATRDCRANWWDGSADPVAGQVFHYEIIWFGSRPVAQVTPGGATRFTFADHLATPQLQTDSAKNVIWRAEYEPFGSIYEMRVGNRNDQPLRFPGQEAAMTWEGFEENYNIFRWYRAAWGRYTQADPIGFQGGINLYAYVRGNPLRLSDRFGLRAFDIFEVPNIPPMPAGHFPNTECCSKRAIQQSIDSVDGQINRMMNGQTPAGTVVAMTLVAYTCHQGECTPLASDPSLFPWGNYKEDKCANYCINFHEWIHFSDLRSWGEHWSETQKTLFHEFPAYVAEKACLLEMRGRAGKP